MCKYCADYAFFLRRKCILFVTLCSDSRRFAEQTVNADSIISPNISCTYLCVGFGEPLGQSAVKVTEIQTAIYYLVRKYTHSTELAYKAIGKILEIVKICSVTNAEVLTAFQKKAKDFEDCLVAVCAKSINCDYIVTRNIRYFEEFDVPAIAPADFLSRI